MFEIGSSLREARTRQGLDINEMEFRTKVRAKYLRALEAEQFDQLPGHTYIKGFLRTYADSLGMDGQLYVDEYNSRYVAGRGRAAAPDAARPERAAARQRQQRESRLVAIAVTAIVIADRPRDRGLEVRRPDRAEGAGRERAAPSRRRRPSPGASR